MISRGRTPIPFLTGPALPETKIEQSGQAQTALAAYRKGMLAVASRNADANSTYKKAMARVAGLNAATRQTMAKIADGNLQVNKTMASIASQREKRLGETGGELTQVQAARLKMDIAGERRQLDKAEFDLASYDTSDEAVKTIVDDSKEALNTRRGELNTLEQSIASMTTQRTPTGGISAFSPATESALLEVARRAKTGKYTLDDFVREIQRKHRNYSAGQLAKIWAAAR